MARHTGRAARIKASMSARSGRCTRYDQWPAAAKNGSTGLRVTMPPNPLPTSVRTPPSASSSTRNCSL